MSADCPLPFGATRFVDCKPGSIISNEAPMNVSEAVHLLDGLFDLRFEKLTELRPKTVALLETGLICPLGSRRSANGCVHVAEKSAGGNWGVELAENSRVVTMRACPDAPYLTAVMIDGTKYPVGITLSHYYCRFGVQEDWYTVGYQRIYAYTKHDGSTFPPRLVNKYFPGDQLDASVAPLACQKEGQVIITQFAQGGSNVTILNKPEDYYVPMIQFGVKRGLSLVDFLREAKKVTG